MYDAEKVELKFSRLRRHLKSQPGSRQIVHSIGTRPQERGTMTFPFTNKMKTESNSKNKASGR